MMVGGASVAKEADDAVQQVCDKIRADLESKLNSSVAEFTAVSVCSQVVAGTNYFVKIRIDSEKYIHARIYQPLPGQGEPSLHSFKEDMVRDDVLGYF